MRLKLLGLPEMTGAFFLNRQLLTATIFYSRCILRGDVIYILVNNISQKVSILIIIRLGLMLALFYDWLRLCHRLELKLVSKEGIASVLRMAQVQMILKNFAV